MKCQKSKQEHTQSRQMLCREEHVTYRYSVHLDDQIEEPEQYRELISALFKASPEDEFIFFINSIGGDLGSAMAIIEGMKASPAMIRCVVLGACHSAASMITMYADNVIVLDSAHTLIHTASFGSSGTTANVKSHTDFTVKQIEKFLDLTYEGFLQPAELVQVKKGVEMWFDADQIRSRLKKREDYRKQLERKTKKGNKDGVLPSNGT